MAFSIGISEFRNMIIIERATTEINNDKVPVEKYIKLFETRAKIINLRGEEFHNLGTNYKETKTFYIRYNRMFPLKVSDRIVYKGYNYNINYINNVEERNKYLEIRAEVLNGD